MYKVYKASGMTAGAACLCMYYAAAADVHRSCCVSLPVA